MEQPNVVSVGQIAQKQIRKLKERAEGKRGTNSPDADICIVSNNGPKFKKIGVMWVNDGQNCKIILDGTSVPLNDKAQLFVFPKKGKSICAKEVSHEIRMD